MGFWTSKSNENGGGASSGGDGWLLGGVNTFNAVGSPTPADIEGVYTSFGNFGFTPDVLRVPVPLPGNLRRFSVEAFTNTMDGASDFHVMVNGVNTVLVLRFEAAETGYKIVDIPVAFSPSDKISFRVTQGQVAAMTGSLKFSTSVQIVPTQP